MDLFWEAQHASTGMVALDRSPPLHGSASFPWDPSKGIYILNAHHGLHCLVGSPISCLAGLSADPTQKAIYFALRDYESGRQPLTPLSHLTHCLVTLREDVRCFADDTPRGSIDWDVNDGESHLQYRQCRDWDRLEAWATDHSTCFKKAAVGDPISGTLEEWTFCPEKSPYRDVVDEWLRIHKKGGK